MPAPAPLRFEWVTDSERFLALKEPWDALGESAIDTIFLTHAWLGAWLRTMAHDAEPHVLTAWDGDELVGALPLVGRAGDGRGRRWTFVGCGVLTPNHLDIIARPDVRDQVTVGFLGMLVEASGQWDAIDFDKVPADTGTAERLEVAFADAGFMTRRSARSVCPYCELPPTMDEYVASRRTRMRKKLRQTLRRYSEQPGPTDISVAETEADALEALSELIRLHQLRWTERGYPGAFADPNVVRFHETLVPQALRDGHLRLSVLRDHGHIAAVNYDFRVRGTNEAYLDSFDEAYYLWSPGVLMRYHVIERSIAEGLTRFDYLEGDEPHKSEWCTGQRPDMRIEVFNHTLSGRGALLKSRGEAAVIAAARRWVPLETRERVLKTLASRNAGRPAPGGADQKSSAE